MRIRIWRRARLLWCWRCPVCQRTWRNRQAVIIRRPIRPTKYYPSWSVEVNALDAWERCLRGAYTHIKKYHSDMIETVNQEEEKK